MGVRRAQSAWTALLVRGLFERAAALSMLLCLASACLWVWSYAQPVWQFGTPAPKPPSRTTELALGNGYLAVSSIEMLAETPRVGPGYRYGGDADGWSMLGVRWRRQRLTLLSPQDRVVVALLHRSSTFSVWLGVPLLVSVVLPLWWLVWAWRARRARPPGTCRVCGYDLRASKQRCPECGTAIPATSA